MRSHTYDFTSREFARTVLPTAGVLLALMAALCAAARVSWLPKPATTLLADETMLRHQANASMRRHPAQIALVGDSTCLVSVDAAELSRQLPEHPASINLGLVIGIDLGSYAQAVADFAAANPGQLRWVVLLVGPLKLAMRGENSEEQDFWRQIRDDARVSKARPPFAQPAGDRFGTRLLRDRLASRLLPTVLRGRGGGFFGFTTELDRYMTEHDGSLLDFGESAPRTDLVAADWFIAPEFEGACREFRNRLPPGLKLAIGLTPVPAAVSAPHTRELHLKCLRQWNEWIQADLVLTNLPVSLPTPWFSESAHLNKRGQDAFTSALAMELSHRP